MSATEAARRIRAGDISAEELVQDCLARIAERERTVRAWAFINPDLALRQARSRDGAKRPLGPLHGIPVGVKDIIDTADMPTVYNSPIYRGHRLRRDAECVARLRAAGAIILGKTQTSEFAFLHAAHTRNPHNPRHTPGGSSSGSVAGVADFMMPLALGTQTGGSTIRPAAYCGVFAFKPTYQRVPVAGVKSLAASFDTIGNNVFNRPWTAMHLPCLTIPAGVGPAGLPVGIQLVGRRNADRALLALGQRVSRVIRSSPPPL